MSKTNADVVLIGAGIMSATIGTLLKELEPDLSIAVFEKLPGAAQESSDAWNNAGTGHSAFCELNYTPQKDDGSVDVTKAVQIASAFEISREFWAHLVEHRKFAEPAQFIHPVPHMSFVRGPEDVSFLKRRYEALVSHPLFYGMKYSEDIEELRSWMPLVIDNRSDGMPLAATRMDAGTDVNFGSLARGMLRYLATLPGVEIHLRSEVKDLERAADGRRWRVIVESADGDKSELNAGFVFIGAGGGSLHLLDQSDIPEAQGFAGFPVSGQWLKCVNPHVIERHAAKVYGKAAVGTPPMSVPHLDTRIIDGKRELLFGPYAGFTTKFLKQGSIFDLPLSLELDNILPMIAVGLRNVPLTRYLVEQALQSPEDRLRELRNYVPTARLEDWELLVAGQRVQVIKADAREVGRLEFGTEVVAGSDGTIAALLGASPGASTAVKIMLDVLEKCFPDRMHIWKRRIQDMMPSYGVDLSDPQVCRKTRAWTSRVLCL
jgi:malate dehydrogenase (quinone)